MTAIDVFLIAGQSNATGYSNASGPTVPSGKVLQYYNGSLSAANDPVGAGTGSAWPQFGATYYNITGKMVCFVPTAVGGTYQVGPTSNGGDWDTTGLLVPLSISALSSAISALSSAGYSSNIAGILWAQGEADSGNIQSGAITATQYQNALTNMIGRFRASFANIPFYISLTGGPLGGDFQGARTLRAIQRVVADADPLTRVVFDEAPSFIFRGLMQQDVGAGNSYHYTQEGYNIMGRTMAKSIIRGEAIPDLQTHSGVIVYNLASASSSVSYTGVGFKPEYVDFNCTIAGTQSMCFGSDSINTRGLINSYTSSGSTVFNPDSAHSIFMIPGSSTSDYIIGIVASMDTDGFTVQWTKIGSPTGVATIIYRAKAL